MGWKEAVMWNSDYYIFEYNQSFRNGLYYNEKIEQYGVEYIPKSGYPNKINNVNDAEKCLRDILLRNDHKNIAEIRNKDIIDNQKIIGDLHIYSKNHNKPMEFIPYENKKNNL